MVLNLINKALSILGIMVVSSNKDAKYVTELEEQLEESRILINVLKVKLHHIIEERTYLATELRRKKYLNININQPTTNNQFTEKEIKQLISLCHPDKHGNSKSSSEITKKLLDMRK